MKPHLSKYIPHLLFLGLCAVFACTQEDGHESPAGKVSFSMIALEGFETYNPNSRTSSNSLWEHVYAPSIFINITNQVTGGSYSVRYFPDGSEGPMEIELPLGDYSYSIVSNGGDAEAYLPFSAEAEFTVDGSPLSLTPMAHTDYGLITFDKAYVEDIEVLNTGFPALGSTEDFYYLYVKRDIELEVGITPIGNRSRVVKSIVSLAESHQHFHLTPSPTNNSQFDLALAPFDYTNEKIVSSLLGADIIYDIDSNAYKTYEFGTQTWMATPLRTRHFNNGEPILYNAGLQNITYLSAYPIYETKNYEVLYTWGAAIDSAGVCPCGYKVPSMEDWEALGANTIAEAYPEGDYWSTTFLRGTHKGEYEHYDSVAFAGSVYVYEIYGTGNMVAEFLGNEAYVFSRIICFKENGE